MGATLQEKLDFINSNKIAANRPGKGTEDEEQGIISAERQPCGRVVLRTSLLAAGFLIGPAASTVREIMRVTGCDIWGWVDRASRSRVFVVAGDGKAVGAAMEIITTAVDRYKELLEMDRQGQSVRYKQCVMGIEFSFRPLLRNPVPYAAALKGDITRVGKETGETSGTACAIVVLAPAQAAPSAVMLAEMEGRWKHDMSGASTHEARTQDGTGLPRREQNGEKKMASDARPCRQPDMPSHSKITTMRAATALPLLYLSRGQMQTVMAVQEFCQQFGKEDTAHFSIRGTMVIYKDRLHAVWGLQRYQGVLAVKLAWFGMSWKQGGWDSSLPPPGQLEYVSIQDLCDTPYDQLTTAQISSLCEKYDRATASRIMPVVSVKQVMKVRFWLLRLNQAVPHIDIALQGITNAERGGLLEAALKATVTAVETPQTPEEKTYLKELIRVCLIHDHPATGDPDHYQSGGDAHNVERRKGRGRRQSRQRNRGVSHSTSSSSDSSNSSSSSSSGTSSSSSGDSSSSSSGTSRSRSRSRSRNCNRSRRSRSDDRRTRSEVYRREGEVQHGGSSGARRKARARSHSIDREAAKRRKRRSHSRSHSRRRTRGRSLSPGRHRSSIRPLPELGTGHRGGSPKQLTDNELLSKYEQRLFNIVVEAGAIGLSMRSISCWVVTRPPVNGSRRGQGCSTSGLILGMRCLESSPFPAQIPKKGCVVRLKTARSRRTSYVCAGTFTCMGPGRSSN